jgi:DNA-binding CsgD family transcriptional regulator
VVVATARREQVRRDVVRLVHRGLGMREFAEDVTRILRRAVAFDGTCLLTIDPATFLLTGEIVNNGLPACATRRLIEIELWEPDYNKFAALARERRLGASLSEATAGDLDRSIRQREVRRPGGLADELRTVLPSATGTWAALTLFRAAGSPHFTPADGQYMASVAEPLADGARRAMLLAAVAGHGEAGGVEPGLVVLAADNSVETANRAGENWLAELGAGDRPGAGLPLVVHAVAARARRAVAGETAVGEAGHGDVARARVRTGAGRWVIARGSLLGEGRDAPVAILLEAARAPELAALVVDAFGFTERERRITELVARGHSTREIANRLHLSTYTVQDHLKSIFDKSGTNARGELVARLFFEHNAPRLASWADTD